MPKFEGSYTVVETGHKTKVVSDVKSPIKNAKSVPWYYAIQYLTADGKPACMLMTEAAWKTGSKSLCDGKELGPADAGKISNIQGVPFKQDIVLYDEVEKRWFAYMFYKNTLKLAIERAKKYPHLCTVLEPKRKSIFSRLFGN